MLRTAKIWSYIYKQLLCSFHVQPLQQTHDSLQPLCLIALSSHMILVPLAIQFPIFCMKLSSSSSSSSSFSSSSFEKREWLGSKITDSEIYGAAATFSHRSTFLEARPRARGESSRGNSAITTRDICYRSILLIFSCLVRR